MKGSVVVKKTYLISCLVDVNFIMRSKASKGAKKTVWGQKMIFEDLLRDEFTNHILDWDKFMRVIEFNSGWMKVGFQFVFGEVEG